MENKTVRRFRKRSIILHWVHTLAFLVLMVTGSIILLRGPGYGGAVSAVRLHFLAAFIFILVPLINYFLEPKNTANFVKETFRWTKEDIQWAVNAPDFYFGGPEEKMPPQGLVNAGQKLWRAVIIGTGVVFVITGLILMFFKWNIPIAMFEWTLLAHGIAFVIVFLMFLIHIYLALLHPRFKESLGSMINGKISSSYARTNYPKWYEKL